jgi:hypothetical protein
MAKSKLAPARLDPQGSPTKYHPVSCAISKAQAAAWLLGELNHGDLACKLGVGPVRMQPGPGMPLPQRDLHDCLTAMESDALFEGLAEAQQEFTKSQAMPKAEVA